MRIRQRGDVIDTRIVLWAYAALVGLTGLMLTLWGGMWLGTDLPSLPWGKVALIRVLGSIMVAAACSACALAGVEDPHARRRGLLWFAAGHAVVLFVLELQNSAIWEARLVFITAQLLLALVIVLFYCGVTAEGDYTRLEPWLWPGTTAPLRSVYQSRIREVARQEERNRLARDLHDSIKQQIFVVQTAAATAEARFAGDLPGTRQALAQVRNSAREAMAEMEAMLDQLRAVPLENLGLVEALTKQCEALGFRTGARVNLHVGRLPPSGSLAAGAQEAVFRVAQEALANVGRHARARNVHVSLDSTRDRLELTVRDDGTGFDPNRVTRGMGVANMQARAEEFKGRFRLWSEPGGGTRVQLSVPYAVLTPERYRWRMEYWGASLATSVVILILTRWSFMLVFVALSGITIARQTFSYRRARRQSEATHEGSVVHRDRR